MVISLLLGIWKAVSSVFPESTMSGCLFHWSQAVFRKIQEVGLAQAYREDNGTRKLLRKMLALPYLPAEHMEGAFRRLREQCTTEALQQVATYMDSTWFQSTVWEPPSWSVFQRSIRTNNDVEGWHRRLNQRIARNDVPFYVIVPLLAEEARMVNLQTRIVSENKLCRDQRAKYRQVQGQLFRLWDTYADGQVSASQLLRRAARLAGL